MATPPGGHPYDGVRQPTGEQARNRFNFPSAPSGQGDQGRQGGQGGQGNQGGQGGQGGGYGGPGGQHQPYPPQHQYNQPRTPRIQPVQQPRRSSAPDPSRDTHNPLVRPYAMTGGRTRPRYQLAIEALVSTTADPSRLQGQLPEHQRICQLCFEIKSVAEISALLSIPLGVARILVADLAEAGLVAIHQPGGDETAGGQPDVTLLERVLSGLRKL
ncbi:DUF742 domain-containing protein [Streptomyces sp. NPDC087420]|uniref:DUF742 domain-containing protein n=1 Tax=Streptomyces sp. NPDC087420 TaxID=3365785 RepID=UPI003838B10D